MEQMMRSGGGTSKTVSQSTVIRDGKKVTKIQTTTRDGKGQSQVTVEEIEEDLRTGQKVHKIQDSNGVLRLAQK
jgi:hypothetical protein